MGLQKKICLPDETVAPEGLKGYLLLLAAFYGCKGFS